MISFKQYLYESEGIYDAMRSSIENRIKKAHKQAHDEGRITEPGFKESHIKQHGLHHSLLDSNELRNKIQIEKHPHDKNAENYKFSINQKYGPPHTVEVEFKDYGYSPIKTEVMFKVNDFYSNMGTVSQHDHQTQHAIYSGLMDSIAHRHYEHGPKEYTFTAHDQNLTLEKRKVKRYEKISKVLHGKS